MTSSTHDLGTAIDALYGLREMRLGLQRKVDELKQQENAQRGVIIALLEGSGLTKASGGAATASVTRKILPIVDDWNSVFAYVATHNRFDLLQKRLSVTAWREMQDSGEEVPGTSSVEDVDISLTKVTRV